MPTRSCRLLAKSIVTLIAIAGCKGNDIQVTEQHTEPIATIQNPADGSSVRQGDLVEFRAQVQDGEDDPQDLSIAWTSDIDGLLQEDNADGSGVVLFTTANLSAGNHAISLTVIDTDAMSAEDAIALTVAPTQDEPTIQIRHPESDEVGIEGERFPFEALVQDATTPANRLLVTFSSDVDSDFCSPIPDSGGIATCDAMLTVGSHQLTFTVLDEDGFSASADVLFEVFSLDDIDDDGDGFTENEGDCADDDASIHPGSNEVPNNADDDCDGQVDEGTDWSDDDGDGYAEIDGDCDDGTIQVSPVGTESCDGRDNDCDGSTDEDTPCADDDGDGRTEIQGDCDDGDITVYPGAFELPDGQDNDCDGIADEGTVRYDADGDCYCEVGPCTTSVNGLCGAILSGDCNDQDDEVNPEQDEIIADGIDQDCDGGDSCQMDQDYDAHGTLTVIPSTDLDCLDPGEAVRSDDCDDLDALIYPGATEVVADGIDSNCDNTELCYTDGDADGHGTAVTLSSADLDCADPREAVTADDCNDAINTVYPGALEVTADEVDQDCDGGEICYVDADSDAYRVDTTTSSADPLCRTSDHEAPAIAALDCEDGNAAIHPNATEGAGDGVDQDCDNHELCYADSDADGYRDTTTVLSNDLACATVDGEAQASAALDCNDTNAAVNPAATELAGDEVDQDCDSVELCYTDADKDGWRLASTLSSTADLFCRTADGEARDSAGLDCNDANAGIRPDASELTGDQIDSNCDGIEVCYVDADHDSYRTNGTVNSSDTTCTSGDGEAPSSAAADCDDTRSSVNPSAAEVVGDSIDENCDGSEICYVDDDRDGYRLSSTVTSGDSICATGNSEANATAGLDCNDAISAVNPGAVEGVGDGVDQNCDGGEICYLDSDNDGYRQSAGNTITSSDTDCTDSTEEPNTSVSDCNDSSSSVHPGASETRGNNIDEDCNGTEICYQDLDNDGYRTGTDQASSDADCNDSQEAVSSDPSTDCNDSNSAIRPGVSEVTGDSIDQNCDGAETCYNDADNDGYRPNSTATRSSADTDCGDSYEATSSDPTTDCNDGNSSIRPGVSETIGDSIDYDCNGQESCYADVDDDGYRLSTTILSYDTDCYDADEGVPSDPATDCYDGNANAHPGSTYYGTIARDGTTNGSYDYNCDGSETKYYTSTWDDGCSGVFDFSCDERDGWWDGSVPNCGVTEEWETDCSCAAGVAFDYSYTFIAQPCR